MKHVVSFLEFLRTIKNQEWIAFYRYSYCIMVMEHRKELQ